MGEQIENVPTGRDVEWEPLVDYRRSGVSETTIHGAVAWASSLEVVGIVRSCQSNPQTGMTSPPTLTTTLGDAATAVMLSFQF